MTRLVVCAAVMFAVAGCGGGETASYDRGRTESCLRAKGYAPETVSEAGLALVGGPAANGVIEFEAQGTGIDVAFDADGEAAENRADDVQSASTAFGGGDVSDAIKTKGNVTYWATGEDNFDEGFSAVEECLTE